MAEALYPVPAYIMEGDTPSFLSLIPNGLGNPERPEIMGQIVRVRDNVLGWVRSTAAYGLAMRTRDAVRHWWRTVRA